MSKNFSIENAIIEEAMAATHIAARSIVDANPSAWYPCGYAWVKIWPSRSRFTEALKELGLGEIDFHDGSFVVRPVKLLTQRMDAKQSGCEAFVAVLLKHYPDVDVEIVTHID